MHPLIKVGDTWLPAAHLLAFRHQDEIIVRVVGTADEETTHYRGAEADELALALDRAAGILHPMEHDRPETVDRARTAKPKAKAAAPRRKGKKR